MISAIRERVRATTVFLLIFAFMAMVHSRTSAAAAHPCSKEDNGAVRNSCFFEDDGIFTGKGSESGIDFPASSVPAGAAMADTLETYDIEIEKESDKGFDYKKLAAYIVAGAFVGYAIYLLLDPGDDEEQEDTGGGKDIPFSLVSFPIVP